MTAYGLYRLLLPGASVLFSEAVETRSALLPSDGLFPELVLMIICEQAIQLFDRNDQIFEFAFTRIRQLGWDRMSLR